MKLARKHIDILLVVLLAVVSRIPLMLHPGMILDGDECIVGLMSKHFIEAGEVPFFFYGQQYGFSFIEVLFISVGYLLAGMSDYVVRLSVFALWVIGVVYCYKSFLLMAKGNKKAAYIGVMLLLVMPAWILWSMKARGGYITAFTLSSIVLYITVREKTSSVGWLFAGILSIVIFYSQPLWLPGLLPFIIYGLFQQGALRSSLPFVGSIIMTLGLFFLILPAGEGLWHPEVFAMPDWHRISITPGYIFDNLTGYYYLHDVFESPAVIHAFVYLFLFCGLLSTVVFFMLWRKVKNNKLLIASAVSVLACLSYLCCIDITSPRYALPFAGYLLVFTFVVAAHINKVAVLPLVTLLIVSGIWSLLRFQYVQNAEVAKADMLQAIDVMEQRGVTHIFCNGPLQQWQFAFYSEEQIIPRYFYTKDRYMPYITAVNNEYSTHPEHTAYIGLGWGNADTGAVQINNSYYLVQQPDKAFLQQMSFDMQ